MDGVGKCSSFLAKEIQKRRGKRKEGLSRRKDVGQKNSGEREKKGSDRSAHARRKPSTTKRREKKNSTAIRAFVEGKREGANKQSREAMAARGIFLRSGSAASLPKKI